MSPRAGLRLATYTSGTPPKWPSPTAPEAALAEGTSLTFVSVEGKVVGLELRGVEPGNLAGRLGLRERDVVLRVDGLPLGSMEEVMAAVERAQRVQRVTVTVLRDGVAHERVLERGG